MILPPTQAAYFCCMESVPAAGDLAPRRLSIEDQQLQRAPTISIVDDDESMRCALKSLVASLGLKAYTFVSAEQFLQSACLDEQQVLLSTLPPSRGQKRLALAIALILLAAFCATLPFATMPIRYTREFIPAYATAMFVISLITSALLYVQFSIVGSRALLAISGGYLFSTVMTVPWALTFPDLFEQTDIASTTWEMLSTLC